MLKLKADLLVIHAVIKSVQKLFSILKNKID